MPSNWARGFQEPGSRTKPRAHFSKTGSVMSSLQLGDGKKIEEIKQGRFQTFLKVKACIMLPISLTVCFNWMESLQRLRVFIGIKGFLSLTLALLKLRSLTVCLSVVFIKF